MSPYIPLTIYVVGVFLVAFICGKYDKDCKDDSDQAFVCFILAFLWPVLLLMVPFFIVATLVTLVYNLGKR